MSYILLIILGLIPSFAWLFFFLKEDLHPEPKKMLALVFFYGACATIVAIFIQLGFKNVLNYFGASQYGLLGFFIFSAVEETLKFTVTYKTVHRSRFFDEPVDAMIYMVTASLGFALVENVAVALNTGDLSAALTTIILRFVGATLLHALSSAIVGYYWAISIMRKEVRHPDILLIEGLAIASVLHAVFNYLIISLQDVLIYPTVFLILTALFVFWDFERLKIANTHKFDH